MADTNDFERLVNQRIHEERQRKALEHQQYQTAMQQQRAYLEARRPAEEQHHREQRQIAQEERARTMAAARYAAHLLKESRIKPHLHFAYDTNPLAGYTIAHVAMGWVIAARKIVAAYDDHWEIEYPGRNGLLLTSKGDLLEFCVDERDINTERLTGNMIYRPIYVASLDGPVAPTMPMSDRGRYEYAPRTVGDEQWIRDHLAQTVAHILA